MASGSLKKGLDFSEFALISMVVVFVVFGLLVLLLSRASLKAPVPLSRKLVTTFAQSIEGFVEGTVKQPQTPMAAANISARSKQIIGCPKLLLDLSVAECSGSLATVQPAGSAATNLANAVAVSGTPLSSAQLAAAQTALSQLSPDLQTVIATLEKAEQQAEQLTQAAWAQLTATERMQLMHKAAELKNHEFATVNSWKGLATKKDKKGLEEAREQEVAYLKSLATSGNAQLAAKFDDQKLMMAAMTIQEAANKVKPNLLAEATRRRSLTPGVNQCSRPGPIYCDSYNLIEIWGPENNTYNTDSVAKIRVDLGGNEIYNDHTGTAIGDLNVCDVTGVQGGDVSAVPDCVQALSVKANIDVSGSDTYTAPTDGMGQGVGLVGVGALIDMAGKDSYTGLVLNQGAGLLGAGLVDDEGTDNDVYSSFGIAQGAAVLGAGAIIDGGGDDTYTSLIIAQGGSLLGAGAVVDASGNDTYTGLLAIGQGASLVGAGAIVDGAGDDKYLGFSIAGIEIPVVMGQGLVFATGAGGLIDLDGKDEYHLLDFGHSYALSAGLVTTSSGKKTTDAYAILFDNGGVDRYVSGKLEVNIADIKLSIDVPAPDTYAVATGYSAARFWDYGSTADTYITTHMDPADPTKTLPDNNKAWSEMEPSPQVTSIWLADYNTGLAKSEGKDQ